MCVLVYHAILVIGFTQQSVPQTQSLGDGIAGKSPQTLGCDSSF